MTKKRRLIASTLAAGAIAASAIALTLPNAQASTSKRVCWTGTTCIAAGKNNHVYNVRGDVQHWRDCGYSFRLHHRLIVESKLADRDGNGDIGDYYRKYGKVVYHNLSAHNCGQK